MDAMVKRLLPLLPLVHASRCTGCGWCVAACPEHLLTLQASGGRKTSTLHNPQDCTGCRKCERRCPFGAIEMVPVLASRD